MLIAPAVAVGQMGAPSSTQVQDGQKQKQSQSESQSAMKMGSMPGMASAMSPTSELLMNESSGTSTQPRGWAMPMAMTRSGAWQLSWMGQAFVVDVQQSHASTPAGTLRRGGDKLYSTNWGMLSAQHALGGGAAMLRTMLSLEPATITGRRYPELFQFGETAFGQAIIDGQHPHNLLMEVAVQYAHPLSNAVVDVYFAPVGDPGLGPTAYPHRASASELPQAPLGHHYEDSTHIAYDVATTEVAWQRIHVESSGFHGGEPGENRWNLGFGPIDSWSSRLTWLPGRNWQAQVSTGMLHHPEAIGAGNEERTTASVEYAGGGTAASVIWGRDYKTSGHYSVNAVTAEGVLPMGRENFITGRYEWSQRDELFADQSALESTLPRWFDIAAYTAGYTRDLGRWHGAELGLGVNGTAYSTGGPGPSDVLENVYGAHPWGVSTYLRVRLKPAYEAMRMH